jgi:hypothetical protein
MNKKQLYDHYLNRKFKEVMELRNKVILLRRKLDNQLDEHHIEICSSGDQHYLKA